MMKALRALVLVGLAAVSVGCLAPRPELEVSRVEVLESSSEGASVLVVLAMENPWDEPVQLGWVDFTVSVEGGASFSDRDLPAASLPASGVQTIELLAALSTEGGAVMGQPFKASGKVTYTPPGDLRVVMTETGIPLPRAEFSYSGVLPTDAVTRR
ncbi:hypothetical protein [Mucisphaera sp.]|uniref:hypothetical protein n=1 Tax=Mucisphaera sp. TaxID=2913024 RepID=UPI003D10036F